MSKIALFLLLLLIALSQFGAFAQQNSKSVAAQSAVTVDPVKIKLERRKISLVDGKEVVQTAEIVKPGEVLEETATYTNRSKSMVRSLEATLPIPVNTELVEGSVKPDKAKASIDGKTFSNMPLTRRIRLANGVISEQKIPVSEYRYLRWYPGELASGKSVAFSARFKVSDEPHLQAK